MRNTCVKLVLNLGKGFYFQRLWPFYLEEWIHLGNYDNRP